MTQRKDHAGRRRLVVTAAVLAASGGAATESLGGQPTMASPVSAITRQCGDILGEGHTAFDIIETGTTCRTARRLADAVTKVAEAPFNGCAVATMSGIALTSSCRKLGFRCRTISREDATTIRVGCRSGGRRIKFTF